MSLYTIKPIILISLKKKLYDVPDARKSHARNIPNLGGIAIFGSSIISISVFTSSESADLIRYMMGGTILAFFVGLKDDILIIAPLKKFIGQFLAALILVVLGGLQINTFNGLFGIYEIADTFGLLLTIFSVLTITNGLNLIDGINGLAGGVGSLICVSFGTFFFVNGNYDWAIIAFSMVGALIGFLRFNVFLGRIFMGDTGSIILGYIVSALTIKFLVDGNDSEIFFSVNCPPVVAFAALIIPLFDTLRVFTLRLFQGKSPFYPDKNHVHHRLLLLGFSHVKASTILVLINLVFVVLGVSLDQFVDPMTNLFVVFVAATVLSYVPMYLIRKRQLNRA